MSLIKWNPDKNLFPSVAAWMDDFFGDNDDWFKPMVKGVSIPAVNIVEGKNEFKLEVVAPGFRKDDLKLEVRNGLLTVSGENQSETENKEEKYARREFRFNKFSRSFSLPDNVDADHISAKYDDGILRLNLPKVVADQEDAVVKTISVN